MDLKTQVLQVITKQRLVKSGDTVIIGVSGGADSVCLLHLLHHLRLNLGIKLHIAHFNHQLRTSADRDEAFVKALAKQLNLSISIAYRPASSQVKKVSEDKARQWRFEFFAKLARQLKADTVALAHHQNDLAETVLMRLLRGSGLSGLKGILNESTVSGQHFTRPLLSIQKKQIEDYLKKNRLTYCQDETNKEAVYLRNKIRLKLLPDLVKNYNANLPKTLVDLAYTAEADYDYLLAQATKLYDKHVRIAKRKVSINLKLLVKEHASMRRMLLRLSFEELTSNLNQLSVVHIQEVEDLLLNRPAGSAVDWPQGVKVLKSATELIVTYQKQAGGLL